MRLGDEHEMTACSLCLGFLPTACTFVSMWVMRKHDAVAKWLSLKPVQHRNAYWLRLTDMD